MPSHDVRNKDPRIEVVSCTRNGGANIIQWGRPRSLSTLEIRAKPADISLTHVARGSMHWEGDHVMIVGKLKDSRGLTKEVVTRISTCLRSIGCRCALD